MRNPARNDSLTPELVDPSPVLTVDPDPTEWVKGRSGATAVRTQRRGMVLLMVSLAWAALVVAVPFLITHHGRNTAVNGIAALTYFMSSLICHQRPERSFHPWGVQAPVCARCEGIYLAAPFAVALMLAAHRSRMRKTRPDWSSRCLWQRILLLASVPTVFTLGWEWMTGDMPSAILRAAEGGVLGAAVAATVAAVAVGELR